MIGQNILKEKLNNVTLTTFPTPLILIGERGCGKHLYSKMISDKLGVQLLDVTNNLNLEFISNNNIEVTPYLYVINMDEVTIKEQNIILKWLEEPPTRSFIVLLTSNIHNILGTVQNRCQKWYFTPYNREELLQFNPNANELASTPGQVIEMLGVDLTPIKELVVKIFDRIADAAISNILTIPDKIAFKDEKDKFNLEIFKKLLLTTICERINLYPTDIKYFNIYKIISKYINDSYIPRVDQKMLLDNLLINLYIELRK